MPASEAPPLTAMGWGPPFSPVPPSARCWVQVILILPGGTRASDMSTQATTGAAQEARVCRVPPAASLALGTLAGVLVSCDWTLPELRCLPAISAPPSSAALSPAVPRVPPRNSGTTGPDHHRPVRGRPLCPALPRTSGSHALPVQPGQRGSRFQGPGGGGFHGDP